MILFSFYYFVSFCVVCLSILFLIQPPGCNYLTFFNLLRPTATAATAATATTTATA